MVPIGQPCECVHCIQSLILLVALPHRSDRRAPRPGRKRKAGEFVEFDSRPTGPWHLELGVPTPPWGTVLFITLFFRAVGIPSASVCHLRPTPEGLCTGIFPHTGISHPLHAGNPPIHLSIHLRSPFCPPNPPFPVDGCLLPEEKRMKLAEEFRDVCVMRPSVSRIGSPYGKGPHRPVFLEAEGWVLAQWLTRSQPAAFCHRSLSPGGGSIQGVGGGIC